MGSSDHVFTAARETRWHSIVEQFSKCYLTYDTDRLMALEGLAREHQKMRDDCYCIGLWSGDLPEYLLLAGAKKLRKSSASMGAMSWSWASTVGEVFYLLPSPGTSWRQTCGPITVMPSGHLSTTVPNEGNSYWLSSEDREFLRDKSLGSTAYRQACRPTYLIFDGSGDRLGWGTFDTEVQALDSIHFISLIHEYPLPEVSISSKERNIVILTKPSTTTTNVFEHRI